jgi:hypothetical protein
MDEGDLNLRNATYALFVELGRAPSADEVAVRNGVPRVEVNGAWARLHDAHALVLDATRTELLMANPFSAVPTPHRVWAGERSWYGNCAWDAFGICAALKTDGRIETTCPDCGDEIGFEVVDGIPGDVDLVFHCLVPAAQWWDDIAFT